MATAVSDLERRVTAHDEDIRHIYREMKKTRRVLREHSQLLGEHSQELQWLRRGMTALLVHAGLDVPPDEPADPEEASQLGARSRIAWRWL